MRIRVIGRKASILAMAISGLWACNNDAGTASASQAVDGRCGVMLIDDELVTADQVAELRSILSPPPSAIESIRLAVDVTLTMQDSGERSSETSMRERWESYRKMSTSLRTEHAKVLNHAVAMDLKMKQLRGARSVVAGECRDAWISSITHRKG